MPKQQHATIIINRTPEEARQQRDDFMRLHVGKSAFDVMLEQQAMLNNFIQRQSLNFGIYDNFFKKYKPQHVFYLSNKVASSKAIELLSALTHSIFTLYELARLFSALSLKTANYQRGISERIVESMTYSLWNVAHARAERFITFAIGRFNDEQKRLFTPP